MVFVAVGVVNVDVLAIADGNVRFLHLLNNFHILSPILQNKEGEILYIIINLISHQNLLTVLL